MSMDQLYQDIILEHYKAKSHSGLREPFGAEVHHVNPSCGDELTLRVQVDDGVVRDVSYEGVGCAISQASTSIMTEQVIGQTIAGAFEQFDEFRALMESQGQVEPDEDVLGDAVAFVGVSKLPARVKCAMLGWSAFKDATVRATAKEDS